jgi:DNA-binding LacI/PurR family transcriptional regulator
MARVGIRDVAALSGVAVGTVSNFLNHPDRVSADKAQRIRYAIDSLGFVPSNAGRQLRLGVSSVIGYIAPDVSNPYFAEIAESVERRASERGVTVFLANSHRSEERENSYIQVFEQHRVQGLLMSSHVPVEDRLAQVRKRGTPSVLVGQRARSSDQPSVSLDDVSGGRQAMRHLLEVGCRRIAFVDARNGAVAARYQNARLRKFLRKPQGFDEAVGSAVEFYAVARRVHLVFEAAAEHDHALQAIWIGGGLCEALLETLHQKVAGRGVECDEEDEGRTRCAEDT